MGQHSGEEKVAAHKSFLEALSRKAPDFTIPLRSHTVWEGMKAVFTCTVVGCPAPKITWFKDGVPLRCPHHAWNYTPKKTYGICTLEIRRCSPADSGKYRVEAKSALGHATTFATLVVNSHLGAASGSERSAALAPEAQLERAFPATWVTEGERLTLQCSFSCPLLAFQQNVTWFRDGVQLEPSKTLDTKTGSEGATLTLEPVHKEHEGFYTVQLKTRTGTKEHTAFVYVKDAAAVVPEGPASPLSVQVSDVNKDYVFLTWQPPSADGGSPVEGYYVERKELGEEQWARCNVRPQKACHFPVYGLKPGARYQFRVCAVNRAGAGRPSKPTAPVLTADPQEAARTMEVSVDGGRTITLTKDELEGEVKVPLPPTEVCACEVTDTFLVLSWREPEPRGREALTYRVERKQAAIFIIQKLPKEVGLWVALTTVMCWVLSILPSGVLSRLSGCSHDGPVLRSTTAPVCVGLSLRSVWCASLTKHYVLSGGRRLYCPRSAPSSHYCRGLLTYWAVVGGSSHTCPGGALTELSGSVWLLTTVPLSVALTTVWCALTTKVLVTVVSHFVRVCSHLLPCVLSLRPCGGALTTDPVWVLSLRPFRGALTTGLAGWCSHDWPVAPHDGPGLVCSHLLSPVPGLRSLRRVRRTTVLRVLSLLSGPVCAHYCPCLWYSHYGPVWWLARRCPWPGVCAH
uniref:Titin n=1 Tax=Knipowitschia caucasica TaxID=637954 RepID=A0AAV2MA98_KNICA